MSKAAPGSALVQESRVLTEERDLAVSRGEEVEVHELKLRLEHRLVVKEDPEEALSPRPRSGPSERASASAFFLRLGGSQHSLPVRGLHVDAAPLLAPEQVDLVVVAVGLEENLVVVGALAFLFLVVVVVVFLRLLLPFLPALSVFLLARTIVVACRGRHRRRLS